MKQQKKYKSRGRNICNMQYFYFYAKNRIKIEKILLSNILNEIFFMLLLYQKSKENQELFLIFLPNKNEKKRNWVI